ncbi:MAG TPA: hypothetical protein VNA20_06610 [Frankiaceae bacterium]|nr:hypothetical protein [Frankiaceae bacterium]
MNRYDEDRVIALLREAVPPVPDAPDRMAAVKHRAGRQRATMWTQTLGAVASVLLVVGVAAAVSGPEGPRRIDPTDEPLKALALALVNQTSVRFEATMEPIGDPKPVPEAGLTSEQVKEVMTARVSGAATRDGDFSIAGDASFIQSWALGYDAAMGGSRATAEELRYDVDFRFVDGVAYRTAMPDEDLPAGKKWVSDRNTDVQDVDDVRRAINLLGTIAENVRYVREYEIASEPVAEYELTVPAKATSSVPVKVRFALDAANRLRRVTSQFSFTKLTMGGGYEEMSAEVQPPPMSFGSGTGSGWTGYSQDTGQDPMPPDADPLEVKVQVDLFGYGESVSITAPPAREVVTENELYGAPDSTAIDECMEKAGKDQQKVQLCFDAARGRSSTQPPGGPQPEECVKESDGSVTCTSTAGPYGPGATPPPPGSSSGSSGYVRPAPAHVPLATLSPAA